MENKAPKRIKYKGQIYEAVELEESRGRAGHERKRVHKDGDYEIYSFHSNPAGMNYQYGYDLYKNGNHIDTDVDFNVLKRKKELLKIGDELNAGNGKLRMIKGRQLLNPNDDDSFADYIFKTNLPYDGLTDMSGKELVNRWGIKDDSIVIYDAKSSVIKDILPNEAAFRKKYQFDI